MIGPAASPRLVPTPAILFILALAGCGRVGDPLPPLVQVPEPVSDLAVSQRAYALEFTWTNPVSTTEGAPLADRSLARIRSGGEVVLEVPVLGPGEPQTAELDVGDRTGSASDYSVEIEGPGGHVSAPSNRVSFTVAPVPEAVRELTGIVDQGRVLLSWVLPPGAPVAAVRIYRSGELVAELPGPGTRFEDRSGVPGTAYTYVVTAAAAPPALREGIPATVEVDGVDRVPPGAPAGLVLRVVDQDAFLTWEPGTEADLAGYRILRRSGQAAAGFGPLNEELFAVTGYTDGDYVPGYAYAVVAVDRRGNESPPSEPVD